MFRSDLTNDTTSRISQFWVAGKDSFGILFQFMRTIDVIKKNLWKKCFFFNLPNPKDLEDNAIRKKVYSLDDFEQLVPFLDDRDGIEMKSGNDWRKILDAEKLKKIVKFNPLKPLRSHAKNMDVTKSNFAGHS
ncbi:unnamed protein product [Lepeophtheirus salmonis]|uniref:(salmon louse) hypothetical protein n=1 Tax=Lepeophtheirus salmonis TaxID=72036 RepID=A0A7R8HC46_LEPSM|nr:unnamed protein product [Lepeophtheirus salmonis]CAF2983002.1 unnamed protein product [Lepeophtheirus salmonis]